jgi:hypothetical protein
MKIRLKEIKVPKNKVKKNTGITDFYIFYSYIKAPNPGTIIKPYVPKSRFSDHKYALDLMSWRKIIHAYFENVQDYILNGHTFKPATQMGHFTMTKYRKKDVFKRYRNIKDKSTLTYSWGELCPLLAWIKSSKFKYEFLNNYRLKLSQSFSTKIHERLIADKDFINTFNDIRTGATL